MQVRELVVKYEARPCAPPWPEQRHASPRAFAAFFAGLLDEEPVEVVAVACLDTKLHLIGYHIVGRGTLGTCVVHPRDVFKVALLSNAAAVILAHNHPSGDPTASADDLALTTRLKSAGELVGVDLVDHVIVCDGGRYFSFKESGRL